MNVETDRVRDIFLAALKVPPMQREAYLGEACGGDQELRNHVERLLHAHAELGSIVEQSGEPLRPTVDEPTAERPGTVIGHYKLLEEIGEGGMGTVWMAQQTEPVKRLVALKLIKAGMDSRQVIARFEAERQALALMDHPNIAKVLDGGTTPTGRLYFVMDLVKGVPITRYCDEHHLTPRQRLELFIPVCHAVQHAHQKGIIHRDLKPSNVLVALYDGKPVPKVIDFGVAKAIGQPLTEQTLVTGFGAIVGTLEYMSPEQAEINQLDIDTRSDIYSLGVLLYELLTGTTPLEHKRVKESGLIEALRIIREEEVPTLSNRLGSTAELPAIAANRGTEPAKLTKLVRGELDWIVMKALEKDRNRRYETAIGFAMDVQRYLADEPVQACPPSLGYRLRKFVRRHLSVVLVAAALALALLLAVGSLAIVAVVLGQSNTQVRRALAEKSKAFDGLQVEKRKTEQALDREQKALRDLQAEEQRTKLALSHHTIALADREWWLNNPGKAEELLDAVPEEFRRWEWHYLKWRCHRELLTLRGHSERVCLVGYSANGTDILTASQDSTLRVWDAATGTQRRQFEVPRGCTVLAFSADGTRAVLGGRREDDSIRFWVWDTATGRELFATDALPPRSKPTAAAFSPDGQRLAVGTYPFAVKVFNVATGREEASMRLPGATALMRPKAVLGVHRLAFAPDGKWLAGSIQGEPSQVLRWDATSGEPLAQLKRIPPLTAGLAVSPDGRFLAGLGSSGEVVIVDVRLGTIAARTEMLDDDDTALAESSEPVQYSQDGKMLAAGGRDGTIRFWDPAGRLVRVFRAHASSVRSIAFSPDGRCLASASLDHTVKVWNVHEDQEAMILSPQSLISVPVGRVAFAPDSRRFAAGPLAKPDAPRDIRVWDDTGGKEITISCDANHVTQLHFSPGGQYLVATLQFARSHGTEKVVKVYDAMSGREHFSTPVLHPNAICRLAISRDGRRLVTVQGIGPEIVMKVVDTDSLKELTTILLGAKTVTDHLELSHDGRVLIASVRVPGGNGLQVWDTASGASSLTILLGDKSLTDVTFSPDGKQLAVGTSDGTVTLYEQETGRKLREWRAHLHGAQVAFSPDGKRLATLGGDKRVKLWDPTTGRALLTLPAVRNLQRFNQLLFSLDGARLMLVGYQDAIVWDGMPRKGETGR